MYEVKVAHDAEVLGRKFKIYGTFEEPLFLAKDVAEWIEYDTSSIHKMLASVDEDEKVRKIVPTPGGPQEMWFLTENGLYEVLMLSRKPIAKQFKKQVKRILREIRTTGSYVSPVTEDDPALAVAKGLVAAKGIIDEQARVIAALQMRLADAQERLEVVTGLRNLRNSYSLAEAAQLIGAATGIEIGRVRLIELLTRWGYICKAPYEHLRPTQYAVKLGILELKLREYCQNGEMTVSSTTRATFKGLEFFARKLKAQNCLPPPKHSCEALTLAEPDDILGLGILM